MPGPNPNPTLTPPERGSPERRGAVRVVAGYALFASCWVLFSDLAADSLAGRELYLTQSAKGMVFVAITSGLLYRG